MVGVTVLCYVKAGLELGGVSTDAILAQVQNRTGLSPDPNPDPNPHPNPNPNPNPDFNPNPNPNPKPNPDPDPDPDPDQVQNRTGLSKGSVTPSDPTLAALVGVEAGDTWLYELGFWLMAVLATTTTLLPHFLTTFTTLLPYHLYYLATLPPLLPYYLTILPPYYPYLF